MNKFQFTISSILNQYIFMPFNPDYHIIKNSNFFDPEYYLQTYPDIKATGQNPLKHFIKHGWREGRNPSLWFNTSLYLSTYSDVALNRINPLVHYIKHGEQEDRKNISFIQKGNLNYISEKETVIFVSHESSASGAPLLGYNITLSLLGKYNIIHIVMQKSNIHNSFLDTCDMILHGIQDNSYSNAFAFLKYIQKTRDIKCVLCNSVVTYPVLHAASELNIPTLSLIHEFSDYTRPSGIIFNTIQYADHIVIPATIIQSSIQKELFKFLDYKLLPNNIHIIPQGKLPYIPESYGDDNSVDDLYIKLKMAPSDDVKIIVGSGWVQIRKGVDLFISTARYIKQLYNGKCKFVWVGDGFDPEYDLVYSVWLQREIEFSGLGNDFIILEHQKNLDAIFSISDVFCLTSRMDPFPNVVIDALEHDMHIACFDDASGSSEFLQKHGASCTIVDYVDTYRLAEGIIDYFDSGETKHGVNCQLVETHLDFNRYVDALDDLIAQSVDFKIKSQMIIDTLIVSGEFDPEFYPGIGLAVERCRMYVENSLKGIHNYNPKAGFSQIKWIEEHTHENPYIVPLYEALRSGQTTTHDVVIIPSKQSKTIDFVYAVHLHLFYIDLAEEFAVYFKNLPGQFDILITIVNEEDRAPALEAFSICGANAIKIVYVENIGRDSGPLFFGLKEEVLESGYEVIGHFHSKKSFDITGGLGDRWRKYLMDNLVGDTNIASSVLGIFNDPVVGLVFPDDFHVVDIGKNKEHIDSLCEILSLPSVDETPIFPLGNMFWARVVAIKDLFTLDPAVILQKEPLPYDGSYMHALERITPHLVVNRGYGYKTVHKKGTMW